MGYLVSPENLAYGILVEVYLILLFALYGLLRELFKRRSK